MIIRFDDEYGEIKSVSGVFDIVFTEQLKIDEEILECYKPSSIIFEPFRNHGYDINTALEIIKDGIKTTSYLSIEMAAAYRINTEDSYHPVWPLSIDDYPHYYPSNCIPNPIAYYLDMGTETRGIFKSMINGDHRDVLRRLRCRTGYHNILDTALTIKLFEDIVSGKFYGFRQPVDWDDEWVAESFDEVYESYE